MSSVYEVAKGVEATYSGICIYNGVASNKDPRKMLLSDIGCSMPMSGANHSNKDE